jgi:hypothetical protein
VLAIPSFITALSPESISCSVKLSLTANLILKYPV